MRSNRFAALALAAVGGLAAGAAHAATYASVMSTSPIVAAVPVPSSQCVQVPATVQPGTTGAGALVGGITGAAIGNSIGGPGRALATGIGLIAGSLIGNQIEANATLPVATALTQCQSVASFQNRTIGYHVVYDYQGLRHAVDLAQAPGALIAVDAAGNALLAAAPAVAVPAPVQVATVDVPYEYAAPYMVAPWPVVGVGIGWQGGGWHGGGPRGGGWHR